MAMNKKTSILTLAVCLTAVAGKAQIVDDNARTFIADDYVKPFSHLDLGLSVGTVGYGLELSAPLASFARVRTGFHYLPGIEVSMNFGIQVSKDPDRSQSKFEKMQGLLESLTGRKVDRQIDMIGKPVNFWNWDVLVDFYPLRNNKHWHVTAGFYLGKSRIAKAYNTTEDMTSLLAVGMYNNMYDKLVNDYTKNNPSWKYETSLIDFGDMADVSFNDPVLMEKLQRKFDKTGRMGVHVGNYVRDAYYPEDVYIQVSDYDDDVLDEDGNPMEITRDVLVHRKGDVIEGRAKGDPYIMEPDENGMVKADLRVNSFKPYLGIGYEGRLSKRDDRYKVAVDCGVLFWGGSPSVKTHEGVDLANDVENIGGKVGRYVEVIDKFKVYPVVSVRLTRRLF